MCSATVRWVFLLHTPCSPTLPLTRKVSQHLENSHEVRPIYVEDLYFFFLFFLLFFLLHWIFLAKIGILRGCVVGGGALVIAPHQRKVQCWDCSRLVTVNGARQLWVFLFLLDMRGVCPDVSCVKGWFFCVFCVFVSFFFVYSSHFHIFYSCTCHLYGNGGLQRHHAVKKGP